MDAKDLHYKKRSFIVFRSVYRHITTWLYANAAYLLPCLVFAAHALLLRGWIIDDAGISYAYARNLGTGYGLVSQPGLPPVEGFSNFLWVVILAPLFALKIFDPVVVPKLLSFVLVCLTFRILFLVITRIFKQTPLMAAFALFLIAVNPSFTIWTISGLENPLFVLLITLQLWLCLQVVTMKISAVRGAITAGLCASAIAMTRPDGAIYAPLYPIMLVSLYVTLKRNQKTYSLLPVIIYAAVVGMTMGAFLCFRITYFHDTVPNTYHSKGGPSLPDIVRLLLIRPWYMNKALDLFSSVNSMFSGYMLIMLVAFSACLVPLKRLNIEIWGLLLFLFTASVDYLLMPGDWMHEYRFATPFIILIFTYMVVLANSYFQGFSRWSKQMRILAIALVALCLLMQVSFGLKRTIAFAQNPTVPFARVAESFGLKFNSYAEVLGKTKASLLCSDLGGTLYYSKLRIYDLAGLCDKTIAKTAHSNKALFYNYIFETAKPTFIHLHTHWKTFAEFDKEPRFRANYVPIYVFSGPAGKSYANYVRKDALGDDPHKLDLLRTINPGPVAEW